MRQCIGCVVIQMWVIRPEDAIEPSSNVWWPAISTEGETFQPIPSSRAGEAPDPSVARPPPPFDPVKFSGLIDQVCTSRSRARSKLDKIASFVSGKSPRANCGPHRDTSTAGQERVGATNRNSYDTGPAGARLEVRSDGLAGAVG